MNNNIDDNLWRVFDKFNKERTRQLYDRFPGQYRALVVETNDPLNIHRVRFQCPELHNFALKPEKCPWAVPAFPHGGKGSGDWCAPCIGDIVWISFEKQHPYGPIWIGHAEPTRRRFYKLHALYQKTQQYVDKEGKPQGGDNIDWIPKYIPADGRPYSCGRSDRYGNMFVMDMTGFYPTEHSVTPAPLGSDALTQSSIDAQSSQPNKNKPDLKMMSMITKCGHYMILGDQGYKWDNEFKGDFDKDHDIEKKRINNLKKLLNEDEPDSSSRDQRRIEFRTDYGHKLEMRDVGYASKGGYAAQSGKTDGTSRKDDLFEDAKSKSDFADRDERWLKIATKGGMLMQFMDMGFHPTDDTYVKRNRLDEVGGKVDEEDDSWQDRDARQMRFISRYGFKFVLDDRGSDESNAETVENMHGNGMLLKGRRFAAAKYYLGAGKNESSPDRVLPQVSGGSSAYGPKFSEDTDPTSGRGFGVDINEKDDLNRMLLYSPMSKFMELNDRYGYVMLSTDTTEPISETWQNRKENEFATNCGMGAGDPENNAYVLKLDRANTYVCLRTPTNQAFEARDGWNQKDEAFIEMRDVDDRGVVLSKALKLSAMHDGTSTKYIMLNDDDDTILIHNQKGKIQLYAVSDIEIIANGNISHTCGGEYTVNCSRHIINAGGGQHVVDGSSHGSNVDIHAPNIFGYKVGCWPGPGAGTQSPVGAVAPEKVPNIAPEMTPKSRNKRGNNPYIAVNMEIIKDKEEL